jgi:hypothetical protein
MAYIGNTVENQGFTPAIDYFNGDGVTVTFTLSRPIASVAQVIVAIDNVIQNPSSSFTVVGNSITFTSAPLAGTNNIWVEYTSLITTYQGISQDPTVIGDIRATGGYLAEGDFGNSFIDGNLIDYVTGAGRLTVGELDDLVFYHGGTSARSEMMRLSYAGNSTLEGKLTATGNGSFQGVYIGRGAGAVSTNTVLGSGALNANTSGATNTSIGFQSLRVATANNNTALGAYSGYSLTTGTANILIGREAGYFSTTGDNNTVVGDTAFAYVATSTGSNNTAIGKSALQANTTASNNTAVGYQALYTNTTATNNTALGYQAGKLATGAGNTLIGAFAGASISTGTLNTFIGVSANEASGYYVTTGSKNTILGGYSGNQGGLDIRTASNYIVLSDGDGNPELIMGAGYNGFVNQQILTSNTKGGTVNILSRAQIFPTDNTVTSAILLVTASAGEGTAGGYTRSDVIFISKRFGNQISTTNIGTSDGISATNWTYGFDGSNFRVTQNWSASGSSLGTRWSILVVSGANLG